MKLGRTLTILGLAAGAAGALLFQGCSSDDSPGGNPPPAGGGLRPPARPSGPATTSTEERNFAVKSLYIGTTDRAGVVNTDAWQKYGYDIDGKISTRDSTDVCKSGEKATQQDAPNGIDNSFGKNIVQGLLTSVPGDEQTAINDAITAGASTIMFNVKGLTTDAKQTATGVSGMLLAGSLFSATGAKPTFSVADDWPVVYELLTNKTDPKSSSIQFPDGYVTGGVWVNGTAGDVVLSVPLAGQVLPLVIHKAIVTFEHSAATDATNGIIAGVIDTEEFLAALKRPAGGLGFCGSGFEGIATSIRKFSDILSDGTNSAGRNCDAISIGLGFTAVQIGEPKTVAPPVTPSTTDPCDVQDAGADSSSDATTD